MKLLTLTAKNGKDNKGNTDFLNYLINIAYS